MLRPIGWLLTKLPLNNNSCKVTKNLHKDTWICIIKLFIAVIVAVS
jgi:hypothetical protein